MTINKILAFTSVITLMAFIVGCEKSQTASIIQKDPWSYEEKIDKISGEKTYTASATLIDDAQPTKTVEAELTCEGGDMFIQLTLHTKNETAADSQSNIDVTKTKDGQYAMFRMRSGNNTFLKIAMTPDFSNRAIVLLKDPDGFGGISYALANGFGGGTKKNVIDELQGKELFIEIPSKYGSPVVSINVDSPNVQKIFNVCSLVPPYIKKNEQPKETIITPPAETTTKISTS